MLPRGTPLTADNLNHYFVSRTSDTSILGSLVVGKNTTDDEKIVVQSQGFAGLELLGDTADRSGEPGGAYVLLSQDAGDVQGIVGMVNNAGQDGSGKSFSGTVSNSMLIGNRYSGNLHLGAGSVVHAAITPAGRLGIGTVSPSYPLHVIGDVGFSGTLQAGTVPWGRLSGIPSASTSAPGLVQLNNTTTSTATNQAATANAVKTLADRTVTIAGETNVTVSGGTQNLQGNRTWTLGWTGQLAVSRGGTGRSSLTAGQVLFGAGTSAVGIDSNLFWNNSNKRLGIGTTSPSYPLHVAGDIGFTGTLQQGNIPAARITSGTLDVGRIPDLPASKITSGTLGVGRGGTGRTSLSAGRVLFGAGTSAVGIDADLYWDNSNKRLGVGTSIPAEQLHVVGKARFDQGVKTGPFEVVYNPNTECLEFNFVG